MDKYVAYKAFNYVTQQLTLVDCDREMLKKENEELRYKVDNLGSYDENRLKAFRNKTIIVPSMDTKKIFMRNQARMRMLTECIVNQIR